MTIYSVLKEIAYSWIKTLGEVGTVQKLNNKQPKNATEPDKCQNLDIGLALQEEQKNYETKKDKTTTKNTRQKTKHYVIQK